MNSAIFSALSVNGLRYSVRLGCGIEERRVPQFVRFEIRLRFESAPTACQSDRLEDTVCYAALSERLQQVCSAEYHLVEHLCWKAFLQIKELLPKNVQLWIRLIKESPPIPNLQEGTSFYLGDWTDF